MQLSVRRSLAWMALSQGGLFILQFGGTIVMARLLTPYEMGVYAVANAIVGVLSIIRSLGLGPFLIREPELDPRVVTTAFTINALLAIATTVVVAALSGLGGALLGEVGVQHVLLVLALSPLITMFDFLPLARFERTAAFRVVALVNLARVATSTAVTISLALQGFSYMSIAWGNLASVFLGAICMNAVGWRYVSFKLGLYDWRRITRFGLQMMTIGAVGNIAGRLSDLLLGRLVGLSALGLYSRASGLNSLLWDNLHLVIARIVFVDFAERRRRSLPLRESYLKIVAMITALLWPAFAGIAILAGPIVSTVYGAIWIGAALPLSLLSLSGLILTSATMAGEIYVVTGETKRLLRYEMKRTGVGMILFTLGCLGGLVWAAAARVGEAVAIVLLCREDLKRMTQTQASDYTPIFRQSALLTVAACGPAMLLMLANNWSEQTSLSAIAAAVLLGMAAWALCLWLLRHPLFGEAEALARKLYRRMSVRSD